MDATSGKEATGKANSWIARYTFKRVIVYALSRDLLEDLSGTLKMTFINMTYLHKWRCFHFLSIGNWLAEFDFQITVTNVDSRHEFGADNLHGLP